MVSVSFFILTEYSAASSSLTVQAAFIAFFFSIISFFSFAPRSSTEYRFSIFWYMLSFLLFEGVTTTSVSEISSSERMMVPFEIKPLFSSIPAKVLVRTDLPEPDSPTIARDSFSYTSRDTFRIAVSILPRTLNLTSTLRSERSTFLSLVFSIISPPDYI